MVLEGTEWLARVLLVWLASLTIESLRYVIAAGGAFLVFLVWGRRRFAGRLIQGAFPKAAQMLHDFRWSLSTVVVFATFGVAVRHLGDIGILQRYEDVGERGFAYLIGSVVVLLVLQDTYFYWTHRAMHHPLLYRRFHRIHHVSQNPSPWSAYAFAPAEAVVHAIFVPLVWFMLPLHDLAVFTFLTMMILRNVLGHLSVELLPSGFAKGRVTGWLTTTTHHGLHHRYFTTNFGLYFTFWDRLMGTTDARYHERFERVAGGSG